MRIWLLCSALFVGACSRCDAEQADGLLYAPVQKQAGEVPARFHAALPSSVAEFEGDPSAYPPQAQVSAALCRGDDAMFERWLKAIATAAARGPIDEPLRERFAGLAMYCGEAPTRFCASAKRALDQSADNAVLRATWKQCEEAVAAEHTDGTKRVAQLRAQGRVLDFDVETGEFPVNHDVLLGELAALADPALAEVVFEELAPGVDEAGPYRLRAYARGQVYEVPAANQGDWYDLPSVLGLLNTLLREQQSPLRFAALQTDSQIATVVCAPRDELLQDAKSGALALEDADRARAQGRAFERQVIDKLSR